jgi:hypothetical protein
MPPSPPPTGNGGFLPGLPNTGGGGMSGGDGGLFVGFALVASTIFAVAVGLVRRAS